VPASDAEDVVQATLTEAFASRSAPGNAEEVHRWVHGILRHKVADFYRARKREPAADAANEVPAESAPISARDLLRWAEAELPEGEQATGTLDWMLREGDGEKLESIAREERVPAPRVRQRVARLRTFFRARWAKEVALVTTIAVVIVAGVLWERALRQNTPPIAREPVPAPSAPSRELRRAALERCARREYRACLDGLDRAKASDPAGDLDDAVQAARVNAAAALASAAPTDRAAPAPSGSSMNDALPSPSGTNAAVMPRPHGKKTVRRGSSDFSSGTDSLPPPSMAPPPNLK
jgi:DNA-directed RNA polymerase specialized sigma24 family protein